MQTHAHSLWWLRISTFLVAALAASSAAYWVLKWIATAPTSQTSAPVFSSPAPTDPQVVARLLGGGQTSVAAAQAGPIASADSRFKLTGVVADRARGGYALISVDGKAAMPFRVGAQVSDTLVLHSVATRTAALAASVDAPVAFTLELPRLVQP
jgi:general secretion pathway protein C